MSEVFDFDSTAANNNDTPPDGFPENMAYSAVNDSARELMAAIARDVDARGATTTTAGGTQDIFRLAVDQTISALAVGMRFCFIAHANHVIGTPPKLNVNSLGAVEMRWPEHATYTVYTGCIKTGDVIWVVYDGTYFQFINFNITAETVKARYEANADTNVFDDAYKALIDADLPITDAAVRQHVADATDSNVYADADKAVIDNLGTRIFKWKDGNESFSTTTLTDDSDFVFTNLEGGRYRITGWLDWARFGTFGPASGALNRLKMKWNQTAGTVDGQLDLTHNINTDDSESDPVGLYPGGSANRHGTIRTRYDLIEDSHALFHTDQNARTNTLVRRSGITLDGLLVLTGTSGFTVQFSRDGAGGDTVDQVSVMDGSWIELRKLGAV